MIGITMRAQEFIKEEKLGVIAKRTGRTSDRPARGHATESRYKIKSADIDETQLDERGKAPVKLCRSSKPDSALSASDLSSCKAQGERARKTQKSQLIGKKRVKFDGKKIKSVKYGGPLKDYS
jgi:hypothetical protein